MASALVPGAGRRSPFFRRGRVQPPVGARILSRHANQRAVMGRDGCAGTRFGAWQTGRTARTANTLQPHKHPQKHLSPTPQPPRPPPASPKNPTKAPLAPRDKLRQHAPIVAWPKPKPDITPAPCVMGQGKAGGAKHRARQGVREQKLRATHSWHAQQILRYWLLATVARAQRSECSDTIHSLGAVSGSPFQAVLLRIEFSTCRACCHGAPSERPPLARAARQSATMMEENQTMFPLQLQVAPDKNDPAPLILYHGRNCPDGFGAALAAWLYYGDSAQYLGLDHGEIHTVEDLLRVRGRAFYILDFSFAPAVLRAIDERAAKLVLLDHHKSAAEKLTGFACRCGVLHFDMRKSGARLAGEFFPPHQPLPALFRYVEDRDIWKWEFAESAGFLSALDMERQDFARWHELATLAPEELSLFIARGAAMDAKYRKLAADIAEGAQ